MDFAAQLLSFNRGLVSPLALARLDIKRLAMAADVQTNWMTRTLGPMSLRPGLQYLGNTYNNQPSLNVDFAFDQDDTALIELTDGAMRVRVNDVLVARPAIGSTFFDWDSGSSSFIPSAHTVSNFSSSGDSTQEEEAYWRFLAMALRQASATVP